MTRRIGAALSACLILFAACNREGGATPAASTKNGDAAKQGGESKQGPGGGPGGPGGRGPQAVVLGPNDVATVHTALLESAIPISGDLKPIEEIAVRSRMEGDVVGVFAREGDRVSRGTLLARFEAAVQEGDRASSLADREAAKADLTNAQWNADQSAELFKAGAIAERDYRSAQQTLAAAQARLAASEARLKATSQTAEDTRITAPTTGVVSARSVEPGEHVTRGVTLFTVVRNDVLELEAAVPARQAADLKVGQPVRFASTGRLLEGKVARISPTINPANRSITVYVQVPNADGALKGNAFATGRIIGQSLKDAVSIPNAGVRQAVGTNQPFVYRLEGDVVRRQEITLGVVDEALGLTQVLEGLSAGDRVIVGNIGTIGVGTKVRVVTDEGRGKMGGSPGGTNGRSNEKQQAAPKGAAPADSPVKR